MANADLRKAAVVVSSLPESQAARLLDRLERKQAAAIVREMAQLREVARIEQEAAIRDFAARAMRTEPGRSAAGSPFQCLHDMGVQDLLALLAAEHPQTIAMVLSQLPTEQAAVAIDAMAPEEQAAVLSRIAAMDPPSWEIVQDVAGGIRRRLDGATGGKPHAGLVGVVKMLNAMPPSTERTLLGHIAQADPGLLGEIRQAMFGADVAACEWELTGAA